MVCTMFVAILLTLTTTLNQVDAAYFCTAGQSCKKDTKIITGLKCPAEHTHIGARPPRAPVDGSGNFKCPAGSDPAVKIILGHSSSGSDIFFDSFGKTRSTDAVMKKKSMCGGSKGTFKTESTTDPYKSEFNLKMATKIINPKLLNKKVVRAMGYVKGLMCVHKRPRMQIMFNDVVMKNTWGGANEDKWSIEPGCVDEKKNKKDEKDKKIHGSQGKGSIMYQGKSTCSTVGNNLACHQSNNFDSGKSKKNIKFLSINSLSLLIITFDT